MLSRSGRGRRSNGWCSSVLWLVVAFTVIGSAGIVILMGLSALGGDTHLDGAEGSHLAAPGGPPIVKNSPTPRTSASTTATKKPTTHKRANSKRDRMSQLSERQQQQQQRAEQPESVETAGKAEATSQEVKSSQDDPRIRDLEAHFLKAVKGADVELQGAGAAGLADNLAHRSAWLRFVESLPADYVPHYEGSGVVICGGGPVYFSSAVAAALLLRKQGCKLPVEIWHADGESPTDQVKTLLRKFSVEFVDGSRVVHPAGEMGKRSQGKKFPLKSVSLLYSRFQHVLLLDADNFAATNPALLLDSVPYKQTGALFWPDFMSLEPGDIWAVMGLNFAAGFQQESGQILINKLLHWKPLMLACYLNLRHEFYYTLLAGDKDTFQFGWRALGHSFHMVQTPTGSAGLTDKLGFAGHTMVQHDPVDGRPIFFHRNLAKFPSGLRPPAVLNEDDRSWALVMQCIPNDPKDYDACPTLTSWEGGLMRWHSESSQATRKKSNFVQAAGVDLERQVLSIFRQLNRVESYKEYIKVLMGDGPKGSYRQTCRNCKMRKGDDDILMWGCECEGRGGMFRWSEIRDPDSCTLVGNNNGLMTCDGRDETYVGDA